MASSAGIASLTERQARSPLSRSVGGLTPPDAAGRSALTGPGSGLAAPVRDKRPFQRHGRWLLLGRDTLPLSGSVAAWPYLVPGMRSSSAPAALEVFPDAAYPPGEPGYSHRAAVRQADRHSRRPQRGDIPRRRPPARW